MQLIQGMTADGAAGHWFKIDIGGRFFNRDQHTYKDRVRIIRTLKPQSRLPHFKSQAGLLHLVSDFAPASLSYQERLFSTNLHFTITSSTPGE
jgi:hypothetical protein